MKQTTRFLDFIMHVRPCEIGLAFKMLGRIRREERSIAGFTLWLDPASNFGYRLLKDGCYEPDMTSAIFNLLGEDDTFIDIGGNEGWFSLIAASKVGVRGRVLCVEPQERLWPVILRNFSLNSLAQSILIPVAIGQEGVLAEMTLTPSINTGSSSIIPTRRFWKRQQVLCRSLDSICDSYCQDYVRLIKMDVEGYELMALLSASRSLTSQRIRNILIEIHPQQLMKLKQNPSQVHTLLESYGYRHEPLGAVHLFTCE